MPIVWRTLLHHSATSPDVVPVPTPANNASPTPIVTRILNAEEHVLLEFAITPELATVPTTPSTNSAQVTEELLNAVNARPILIVPDPILTVVQPLRESAFASNA